MTSGPLLRTVATVSSPEKPLKRFGAGMIPRFPPTTMHCGVGSKKMSGREQLEETHNVSQKRGLKSNGTKSYSKL